MSSAQTWRMLVTRARQSAISPLRGQAAAGEDVGVGEAAGALLDLVEVVVDRDRLQQHQPVGGEQLVAAAEEVVEVLPADRLDHLDRDQPVVAAAQVAVVLEQHRHPVLEPGLAHPPASPARAARGRSSSSSPGSRARGRRGSRGRPSRCRSPAGGCRGRGGAARRSARASRAAPPPGSRPRAGSRRRSTSSARRGRRRRGRCRGRSGRRCCWRAPARVFSGTRRRTRCSRPRAPATAPRRPSSSRSSRAAIRISATRSSVSQSPST